MRAAVVSDRERAMAVCSWLLEHDDGDVWPRAAAACLHAKGLLDQDTDLLARAAEAMWAIDDPLQAARICGDIVAGDPAALSEQHRRRAVGFLDSAGAWAWLNDIVDHDGAPGPERQGPPDGWAGLTPAQSRIVYLVGTGLSNAAIAEELSISRRTVESHLYHVYPKLQADSRVQLSLAAARHIESGWNPFG